MLAQLLDPSLPVTDDPVDKILREGEGGRMTVKKWIARLNLSDDYVMLYSLVSESTPTSSATITVGKFWLLEMRQNFEISLWEQKNATRMRLDEKRRAPKNSPWPNWSAAAGAAPEMAFYSWWLLCCGVLGVTLEMSWCGDLKSRNLSGRSCNPCRVHTQSGIT